jgi:hypothetical protein
VQPPVGSTADGRRLGRRRLAGPGTAGRALGALEFVALAGLATGSILTPLLLHAVGVRGTLALLGGGLAVLALAHAARFACLDGAIPAPGPDAGCFATCRCPHRCRSRRLSCSQPKSNRASSRPAR